ncbi:GIY-YIG nuclease family protein [Paenibacillus albidus]|uniref:GIY-YIG nuclease family protein n=1 Tax=Paenibacillus albidus TaxID=2041023 RepID=UPI001BE8C274|nr:GIY-YIG nuclease family protein [Paenibacillus albidus]MBT2292535.1 GIY-YIG nuclease family protein [Paenibacillus albidus]
MDKARRKELAYDYAHSHRPMGVFRMVNTKKDKSFVGSSLNLEGVWNKHKFMLDINAHDIKELQADWNKDGEAAFRFEILEQIKPEEDFVQEVSDLAKYRKMLPELEQKWLQELSPYGERGYNKEKKREDS